MSIKAVSWALEEPVTDPIAKLILIGIADKYNEERGFAWPSVKWLATAASCSERTVQRKVRALVDGGYLTVDRRFNDTSCYGLPRLDAGGDTVTGGDTALSGGGDTALSPGVVTNGCHPNNIYNDNNNNNIKGRKQKLVDWTPSDEDRAYATELGLDADELLADIRLWDEQNGNKAAYASVRAFWQGWCRREAKRRPRALKRDYGANGKSWEQKNWSPGEKKPVTAREWRVMNEGMRKWYRLNRPDAIEQLKAEGVDIA